MNKILSALLMSALLAAGADVIVTRDGRSVSGSYLGGDARQVRMVVGDKVQTFAIPDIARIEFSASSVNAPSARADSTATPTSADIPAGTNIVVRLIDSVDSEKDRMGQTYRASLDEPIVLNGELVVDRGADITAKLVEDTQSGKITGKTVITLDLVSLNIKGKTVAIDTEEVTRSSGSRTAKSGKMIGGIAALGAIIGGIAGGGKGAAVGAVAGAGAGTAAQVYTKGEKVKIPSETRLTFILQNAVRL